MMYSLLVLKLMNTYLEFIMYVVLICTFKQTDYLKLCLIVLHSLAASITIANFQLSITPSILC